MSLNNNAVVIAVSEMAIAADSILSTELAVDVSDQVSAVALRNLVVQEVINDLEILQARSVNLSERIIAKRAKIAQLRANMGGFLIPRCSICLEVWNGRAGHGPYSLSCGHFYGRGCLMNWRIQGGISGTLCPVCKFPFVVEDMRPHTIVSRVK